jgi:hypothetical protein
MLEKGKQREVDKKAAKEEHKTPEENNSAPNYLERHS